LVRKKIPSVYFYWSPTIGSAMGSGFPKASDVCLTRKLDDASRIFRRQVVFNRHHRSCSACSSFHRRSLRAKSLRNIGKIRRFRSYWNYAEKRENTGWNLERKGSTMAETKDEMILRGLKENNLKNIDLNLPKGKIIVFTGLSGSGKSSVVFDTLATESRRQMTLNYPLYVRNQMPRYERPQADLMQNLSPVVVVEQ